MIKFKYATRRDREFPIIPITLIKQGVEIETDGLIDSGANISAFRPEREKQKEIHEILYILSDKIHAF